jgi:hypothetical protein
MTLYRVNYKNSYFTFSIDAFIAIFANNQKDASNTSTVGVQSSMLQNINIV